MATKQNKNLTVIETLYLGDRERPKNDPLLSQEREAKEWPLAFLRKAHTILFPPYGTSNASDSCVLCVYICRFMYACEQVHMCAYAYRGQRSPLVLFCRMVPTLCFGTWSLTVPEVGCQAPPISTLLTLRLQA